MFQRFAAACTVASVLIAAAAAVSRLARFPAEGASLLTTAWCLVPVAWGIWAMLAPSHWVPGRLPIWGAILGVAAGVVAGPVLDIPLRTGGWSSIRWIPLIVGPIFYYLLWLLVASAYRSLETAERRA
ncbi:MAG TPA: hypothetical protein VLT85_12925 [Terriglobales bacterium]|nr:hypothetical protein [Terriglobales bacterium]